MRNLLLILLVPFFALGFTGVDKAKLGIGNINYLSNPGFESGTGGWSASGGTFTRTTLNKQFGSASGSWDSSAASQTLTSSQSILLDNNNGLKGKSGLFSCFIKVPSGTATHTMRLFVGTTEYTQTITSDINGASVSIAAVN